MAVSELFVLICYRIATDVLSFKIWIKLVGNRSKLIQPVQFILGERPIVIVIFLRSGESHYYHHEDSTIIINAYWNFIVSYNSIRLKLYEQSIPKNFIKYRTIVVGRDTCDIVCEIYTRCKVCIDFIHVL